MRSNAKIDRSITKTVDEIKALVARLHALEGARKYHPRNPREFGFRANLDDPRLEEAKREGKLVRRWRGKTIVVSVDAEGFTWNGKRYPSISSVCRDITGRSAINGYEFFGLA